MIPNPPKCLFKVFDLSYTDREVDEFFTITMTEAINLRKRNPNLRNDLLTILLSKKTKNMRENTNSDENQVHEDNEHSEIDDDGIRTPVLSNTTTIYGLKITR